MAKYIHFMGRLLAAMHGDGGEGSAAPAPADKIGEALAKTLEGCRANKYAPETDFTLEDDGARGESFRVDAGGVYSIRKYKDQKTNEWKDDDPVKICERLDVLGKTKNADGEQWGRVILFADGDGDKHRLTISMGEVYGGGAGLSQKLGEVGLVVRDFTTRGNMAPINRYLNAFPLADLPTIKTVDCGGWSDESYSCFLYAGGCIRAVKGDVAELGANVPAPRIKTRGNLAEWQKWLNGIAPYSARISFGVLVSLAAPLLSVYGDSSRLFHFFGPSSTGKSTAAKVAATVWGTADEFVNSWDVTKRAPAALAKRFSGFPLIFDELKVAGEMIKDVSYILSSGKDRARCDRYGNVIIGKTWSLYAISSGEGSLAEIKQQNLKGVAAEVATGELVRFIDIPALANPETPENGVFEFLPDDVKDDDASAALTKRKAWIDSFTLRPPFYGTAGTAFVENLERDIAATGVAEFRDAAQKRVSEFSAAFNAKTPTTARVLTAFGIVALAGELATQYGVLPWAPGDATRIASQIFNAWKGAANTLEDRAERFVDSVQDDARRCSNAYRHYNESGIEKNDGARVTPSFGALLTRLTEGGTETMCAAYSTGEFSDLLKRTSGGVSRGEALNFLKDKGRLITNRPANDAHAGEFRAPRRKGALPLGLVGGSCYKLVLLSDDREAVIELLNNLKLNPGSN